METFGYFMTGFVVAYGITRLVFTLIDGAKGCTGDCNQGRKKCNCEK